MYTWQLVFMIMFNDICMITVAWDNVYESKTPKSWNLSNPTPLTPAFTISLAPSPTPGTTSTPTATPQA